MYPIISHSEWQIASPFAPGHEGPCANSWKLFVLFGERVADPQRIGALVEYQNTEEMEPKILNEVRSMVFSLRSLFFVFARLRDLKNANLLMIEVEELQVEKRRSSMVRAIGLLAMYWWLMHLGTSCDCQTMFSTFFWECSGVWSSRTRCWGLVG